MLEQNSERAVQKGLPGLFPSRDGKPEKSNVRERYECIELCGVMYVKPSVLHMKGDKGLVYTQCMLAKRYEDVRDILDCDYKVIAQIVNMLLDIIISKKRQLNKRALVSHCHLTFLSMNLYMS